MLLVFFHWSHAAGFGFFFQIHLVEFIDPIGIGSWTRNRKLGSFFLGQKQLSSSKCQKTKCKYLKLPDEPLAALDELCLVLVGDEAPEEVGARLGRRPGHAVVEPLLIVPTLLRPHRQHLDLNMIEPHTHRLVSMRMKIFLDEICTRMVFSQFTDSGQHSANGVWYMETKSFS